MSNKKKPIFTNTNWGLNISVGLAIVVCVAILAMTFINIYNKDKGTGDSIQSPVTNTRNLDFGDPSNKVVGINFYMLDYAAGDTLPIYNPKNYWIAVQFEGEDDTVHESRIDRVKVTVDSTLEETYASIPTPDGMALRVNPEVLISRVDFGNFPGMTEDQVTFLMNFLLFYDDNLKVPEQETSSSQSVAMEDLLPDTRQGDSSVVSGG